MPGSFQKDHAGFAGSETRYVTAAIQTTTAVPAQLFTMPLADNTLYFFEADVIGRDAAGVQRAFYTRIVRAHRQGGGGAVLGTIFSPQTNESAPALNCTFTTSGNDLRVTVTGLAGVTMNWACTLVFQGVSGSA